MTIAAIGTRFTLGSTLPMPPTVKRANDGAPFESFRAALEAVNTTASEKTAAKTASQAESASAAQAEREAFFDAFGQTLYGQIMSAMRSTLGKPAYFHGGQAEETFQGQLDQILVERMSDATADRLLEPMYQQYRRQRPDAKRREPENDSVEPWQRKVVTNRDATT